MIQSASLIAEALPSIWGSDQDEGRALLQELRRLSRGAQVEMRTLLLELRPTVLVEAGLRNLLRHLAEAATGGIGAPINVTVEGQRTIPSGVHVALYRIAQEASNNVVKHASASKVTVSRSTAKAHVSHILSKLGVSNRAGAIAWALRQKLLSD